MAGEPPDSLSRRDFVTRAGRAVVGATATTAVAGGVGLALPNHGEGRPRRLLLGTRSDFKMGTLTWLEEHELFVVRQVDGFGAFSSRCTHLGCTVRRTADGFQCPCHGATYDRNGRVTAGPARAPLEWFALETGAKGHLWADRDSPVAPGTFTAASESSASESSR
jgi:cytochrome b6-f complex iron-sulfur subunit